MLFAELCYQIFEESTACYHVQDCVDAEMENPYEYKSIEYYLFLKNWVDAVQWHLEDVIRDPDIESRESVGNQTAYRSVESTSDGFGRVAGWIFLG